MRKLADVMAPTKRIGHDTLPWQTAWKGPKRLANRVDVLHKVRESQLYSAEG